MANASLESVYPIVYLDALRMKIRYDGTVQNRCIYLAIGVNLEGKKETLGLWTSNSEGAKFWLSVLTELNNRGVKDIFIACVDGLKGFTEAIESVFPNTITQLCIVHQIRNSLTYISYKNRKSVVSDLKPICTAVTEDEGLFALELFSEKWNAKYPLIAKSWQSNWQRISPMFVLPKEIRRAVYTTNVIELSSPRLLSHLNGERFRGEHLQKRWFLPLCVQEVSGKICEHINNQAPFYIHSY